MATLPLKSQPSTCSPRRGPPGTGDPPVTGEIQAVLITDPAGFYKAGGAAGIVTITVTPG